MLHRRINKDYPRPSPNQAQSMDREALLVQFSRTYISRSPSQEGGTKEKGFRVYAFEVTCPSSGSRTIMKRFNNFVAFDKHWKRLFPDVAKSKNIRPPSLPSRFADGTSDKVVKHRSVMLLVILSSSRFAISEFYSLLGCCRRNRHICMAA